MNIYLVECQAVGGDNDKFLVKANTKKEALEKVWIDYYIHTNKKAREKGFSCYRKTDLYVRNIEKDIFNKDDEVVML